MAVRHRPKGLNARTRWVMAGWPGDRYVVIMHKGVIQPGDEVTTPPGQKPQAGEKLEYSDPLSRIATKVTPFRAFVLALLVFGLGEKILLPVVGGYFELNLDAPLSTWRPDIEALANGFVFVPTIFAAYIWQIKGAPEVLDEFESLGSFTDPTAVDTFNESLHMWFKRPWWPLAAVVAVLAVPVGHFWLWGEGSGTVDPWWAAGEPFSRIVGLILLPLTVYAVAQIVINEVRLAWTLNRFWQEFEGTFELRGRKSGALASLSRHIKTFAAIGLVVLVSVVLGALLPQIRDQDPSISVWAWFTVIWVAYLVVVLGLTFALVWPAHSVMSRKKDERIGTVTRQIDTEFKRVEPGTKSNTAIKNSIARIENLRELRSLLDSELPRWPISNPVRAVSWSVAVPIVLSIITTVLDRFA